MKKKIALFVSSGVTDINNSTTRPVEEWADEHDDYTRVSEFVEIDFPERRPEEFVPEQIKHLRAKQDAIRVEAASKMQHIEDLIGNLEALEHLPEDV